MASQFLNVEVARSLREAAEVLATQGANPFRVNAYRRAATTVEELEESVADIVARGGVDALVDLPHIGAGIAGAIAEIVATGRWRRLDRLRGELDPVRAFRSIPGVGPALATRIHDTLHVDTLEGLEAAALAGRLQEVPGIGARRDAALRAALASILARPSRRGDNRLVPPPVELLLHVDATYRTRAAAGSLPRIAPRRFNPQGKAWLPVLHTERSGWHFSALYSNTARAHELGRTDDWVVIYYYDDHHREGQCTVVTETRGTLAGRRVVRGMEAECRRHYRSVDDGASG